MRGCFLNAVLVAEASVAFPAYAGMFPSQQTPKCLRVSFPRVCGDVSHICDSASLARQLSPRMRGCFYGRRITSFLERAFPAYAGMFLKRFTRKALLTSFPRVCGDVSRLASTNNKKKSLSPRMRGCFSASVFSDSFDSSFPRVCGDVSRRRAVVRLHFGLSPRMRGCFLLLLRSDSRILAFPAYAGMFPITPMTASPSVAFPAYAGMFPVSGVYPCANRCFPRVCGDVSQLIEARARQGGLSPRMRGCFLLPIIPNEPIWAFPAYAGMFPALKASQTAEPGFPRVCGDVSSPAEFLQALNELSPRMRGCFQVHCQQHQNLQAFPAYAGMFPIPLAVACV